MLHSELHLMDRPLSEKKKKKHSNRRRLIWGLLLIGLAGAFFLFRSFLQPSIKANKFVTAPLTVGAIENTISASGLVVPSFEEQVNAPINTQIKRTFLQIGTVVQPDDKILELNKAFIQLEYESSKDQLELRTNNITKLQLAYDKNLADLEYDNQIKNLQIAGMEADLQDAHRLHKIGGATAEQVERATLDLKIAKIEQQKLANELTYRKAVIGSDKRNLELELLIEEKSLKKLQQELRQTVVTAPRSGVITWINEDIGKQVSVGDPLVRIADLGKFRIEASCSDRYGQQVKLGMPVKVRIANKYLMGQISSVLPAIENNTIEFIVQLDHAESELLKPNMRVEVFLISDRKEKVLLAKNGAAFKGGVSQYLYKVQGNKAIRTTVQLGLRNMDKIEIAGDHLQSGDLVIISDMKDYEHLEVVGLD